MAERITFVDKSTLNPKDVPENNKWSGANGQEVKNVINAHADDIEALEASIGSVISAHIQLTQAQVQALNAGVQIEPPAGVGKYYEIMSASAFLKHNGTDYTGGSGDIQLNVGSDVFITNGTNIVTRSVDSTVPLIGVNQFITHNAAMIIKSSNSFTGAGGTIDIYVNYTIRDTN